MSRYDYDVIYIGAGVGSVNGAVPLARRGFKVAIVEAEAIGGTCPNWGCTAKYTLDAPVNLAAQANHFSSIFDQHLDINWFKDMARKHRNIDSGPATGMKKRIKQSGIDVYMGHGSLKNRHEILVNHRVITSQDVVLATGLVPHHVAIPGAGLTHDSRNFLSVDHLPKRVMVIGTGYVGIELATLALAGGADVTVMMHHKTALRGFYQPFVKKLVNSLKRKGMRFVPQANLQSFKKCGSQILVRYGHHQQMMTNYVLDASGRIPNLKHLGLGNAGVAYDRHGIKVDGYLNTNVSNIYACGDVIDSKIEKLSPTATYESRYLTRLLTHQTSQPMEMPPVPTAVFTSPRIAKVGVSVNDAKLAGSSNYRVVVKDLTQHMYYKAIGEKVAARALVFNRFHRLVGAEEVSDRADDAVSILSILISLHATNEQIENIVRLFPSLASDLLSDY